jgi:DNA-binding transcriptional LysR family regulator
MDSTWLLDFVELAKSGSFSKAAEARNVTQPAFSRRIRLLEDWVGATLIDRGSHPVALTEAGIAFASHAGDLVDHLFRARAVAQEAERGSNAALRITTTQVLALSYFPRWLRSIAVQHRIGTVSLLAGGLQPCEHDMLQGRAQFLLCHYREGMPFRLPATDYTSVAIEPDRLMPVALALPGGKPSYSLDEPAETPLPLLAYEPQSGLGRIFGSVFAVERMTPPLTSVATSHLALLLSLVFEGRGIAWVPESTVRTELASGQLAEAGGQHWSIAMEIRLFRPRGRLGANAEQFWSYVAPEGPRRE